MPLALVMLTFGQASDLCAFKHFSQSLPANMDTASAEQVPHANRILHLPHFGSGHSILADGSQYLRKPWPRCWVSPR